MSDMKRKIPSGIPVVRDRAATEQRILDATSELLADGGFAALNMKAIAKAAGTDKVLIYRYFGKLDDLLAAFGEQASFWPSVDEVLAPDNDSLPPAERLTEFFERFIAALRSRPLTVQILAMEVAAPNPLTATLDRTREAWGRTVAERLKRGLDLPVASAPHPLDSTVSLLVAGIQYLLIRARHTPVFGGLAIDEKQGWELLRQHLAWLCTALLPPAAAASRPAAPKPERRPPRKTR